MKYSELDSYGGDHDFKHGDEAGYWVLVTFCQRNFVGSPNATPLRVIYISLTLTSIVAYTALSATLMSTLSIEVDPIKSFAELVASKIEVYGDESASFTHKFVQDIVDRRRQSKGYAENTGGNLSSSRFLDLNTGLQRTLSEPAAYVTFDGAPIVNYRAMGLSDDFVCNKIRVIKIPGSTISAGMFVRKGSILREIFNPWIVTFYEYGFIKRLEKKWSSTAERKCPKKFKQHSTQAMDIGDVHTPISVLLGGFVFSMVLLAIEFNYNLLPLGRDVRRVSREWSSFLKTFISKENGFKSRVQRDF
ncbi:uncharacterized protein LOC118435718 [Folsomia candida]|nr:uncharacterized protein LOC118435718 [Folsomia candida]